MAGSKRLKAAVRQVSERPFFLARRRASLRPGTSPVRPCAGASGRAAFAGRRSPCPCSRPGTDRPRCVVAGVELFSSRGEPQRPPGHPPLLRRVPDGDAGHRLHGGWWPSPCAETGTDHLQLGPRGRAGRVVLSALWGPKCCTARHFDRSGCPSGLPVIFIGERPYTSVHARVTLPRRSGAPLS